MLKVQHYAVPKPLQRYFERATLIDYREAVGLRWLVIPSGSYGLSLMVVDPTTEDEPDSAEIECYFTGVLSRALGTWCDRRCIVVNLRLTPLAAALLPLEAHDFDSNPTVLKAELVDRATLSILRDHVRDARSLDGKMSALLQWAEALMLDRRSQSGRRISVAEAAMRMHDIDGPGVADAAGRVGVSPRQLERDFRRYLGTIPRHYAKVAKVQQFARLTWQTRLNLAGVAAELGFADQAHMTRTVGEITGSSPAALLKRAATSEFARITRPFWDGRLVFV